MRTSSCCHSAMSPLPATSAGKRCWPTNVDQGATAYEHTYTKQHHTSSLTDEEHIACRTSHIAPCCPVAWPAARLVSMRNMATNHVRASQMLIWPCSPPSLACLASR